MRAALRAGVCGICCTPLDGPAAARLAERTAAAECALCGGFGVQSIVDNENCICGAAVEREDWLAISILALLGGQFAGELHR